MTSNPIPRETYSTLYSQAIKSVEWYKRKAFRKGIKVGAIAVIALLLVIAFLAAYALSTPASFVGEGGYHLLGESGLRTCKIVGYIGAVVLTLLLFIYLHKSTFWLSHYIKEDKGFLYTIKDSNSITKGYLYGTIHKLPKGDKGLNDNVLIGLAKSRAVFVECEIPKAKGISRLLRRVMDDYLGIEPGVDFKIMNYANRKAIAVIGFETMQEHEVMLTHFIRVLTRNPVKSRSLVRQLSTREALDRILVAWKTGNEEEVSYLIYELVGDESLKEWADLKLILRELSDDRNARWMKRILIEISESDEKPIFIAVGSMHLFDFPTIETRGLITRLTEEGWKVERVRDMGD
ncbi:MAG: TraB/GumN family protein [Chlamydiales bacterium]